MTQFAALLLRAVLSIFAGLLIAGGTLTLAADRANVPRPTLTAAASGGPRTLTVPQVTGQAYVFAKSILQDNGFAWRVVGPVKGFAGNRVYDQAPRPGTVVLDTGAPTVVLSLAKNPSYAELGAPDGSAPYKGTAVRIPATPLAALKLAPKLAPSLNPRAKAGVKKSSKAKNRSLASRKSS